MLGVRKVVGSCGGSGEEGHSLLALGGGRTLARAAEHCGSAAERAADLRLCGEARQL